MEGIWDNYEHTKMGTLAETADAVYRFSFANQEK
jgi:hypothetical protein